MYTFKTLGIRRKVAKMTKNSCSFINLVGMVRTGNAAHVRLCLSLQPRPTEHLNNYTKLRNSSIEVSELYMKWGSKSAKCPVGQYIGIGRLIYSCCCCCCRRLRRLSCQRFCHETNWRKESGRRERGLIFFPTDPLTILELQNPSIDELYVGWKRQMIYF